jgi:hypothetical protein
MRAARRRFARRGDPGHRVQAGAAGGERVGARSTHPLLELGLAAWQCGDAALARVEVSGRHVEQRLRQAVRPQPRGDLGGRPRVGEQELDTREAIGGRGTEAGEELVLAVHHREVGCEAGHRQDSSTSARRTRGAARRSALR